MFDVIYTASGMTPDLIFVSPIQRSRYAALIGGVIQANFVGRQKAGTADGGFDGFAYAGVEIVGSRHISSGHIVHLSTKSWKVAELGKLELVDDDGNVLSRVAGTDSFEFYMAWYGNLAAVRPNANGVVLGLIL
jgi:hypothetical protein